jgi:BirA family biotin operon repressor/biotin-[acetyl-CoA-carboxylase] ligase
MAQFGSSILRYDSVSSTNDVARELAVSGAGEGVCVIAREQTAGRGRQGRLWSSPPGEGLYLSLVLRPQLNPADSAIMTLAAAVGVAETLKLDFEVAADIKWPNDVLASGRKICGILVESAIQNDQLQYAVIGIGVNIAQRSFPGDLEFSATSLLLETGRLIEPEGFAQPMLERLEHWYKTVITHPDQVIERWEELSSYARGRRVGVESADGAIEGITRGLTSRGALILEMDSGEIRAVVAGEVSLRALNASR